jgi:non-lysosomal glucosylceramidase
MTSNRPESDSLEFGSMTYATTNTHINVQTRWYRGGWWDNAHVFWDDFSDDGKITETKVAQESPEERSDVSSLLVQVELKPGEETTIPFYLTWYFPNRENYWNREKEVMGKLFRNYYSTQFKDSLDAAVYLIENISELYSDTKAFHDILFSSTYPSYVIDALSSQTSSLKTNLLIRTEQGKAFGFEGLTDNSGCCPMNCTHVWNYENTMAYLFPSLERSFRETDFLHNTFDNGYQVFRTLMPLGDYWWKFKPCADGQMGNIVRVYREWKLSGDTEWLKKLWPKVKKALEFAWNGVGHVQEENKWQQEMLKMPWDPDKNGVMEGEQHNTYDIEYYGPNTMTGSLYLAALKAASEMAEALGEGENADLYENIFKQGSKIHDETLWNGEYYIQQVNVLAGLTIPEHLKSLKRKNQETEDPEKKSVRGEASTLKNEQSYPKYQYGLGCLSDQLLGQYLAFVTNLGYVLEKPHINKALDSIFQYNFHQDLSQFSNVQRVYALNEESGLLLCSWPKGNRPALPFVYSDEVWTGIEYQVAASLIYAGRVDKGLKIVESIRKRYRGFNRNPWDELECGHHYARAMASWAVMLALSGFHFDGVNHIISFSPKINQKDFDTFWSTGSGWGSYSLDSQSIKLKAEFGCLKLKEISFSSPYPWKSIKTCTLDSDNIECRLLSEQDPYRLIFKNPIEIKREQNLYISFYRSK